MSPSPSQATRRRLPSATTRIVLLTAAVASVTATLYFSVLRNQGASSSTFHIAWWALVPMVYLAEISLVHLHFRRDNHSFSLSEVALVLALLFSPSWEILLAQVIGATLAFGVHRRLPVLKLALNLAVDALVAAAAVTV